MNTTQNINTIFYQNLGKLFYAIAAADKVVRKAEYESLRNIVKTQWLELEDSEDEFGADAAYQIEIVFDWLDYKELNAQDCFEEFELYFKEHPLFFNERIKKMVWDTANAIADAFPEKTSPSYCYWVV